MLMEVSIPVPSWEMPVFDWLILVQNLVWITDPPTHKMGRQERKFSTVFT